MPRLGRFMGRETLSLILNGTGDYDSSSSSDNENDISDEDFIPPNPSSDEDYEDGDDGEDIDAVRNAHEDDNNVDDNERGRAQNLIMNQPQPVSYIHISHFL